MRILAIDPGMRLGWAVLPARGAPQTGSQELTKDAGDLGKLLEYFAAFLRHLITEYCPDKIVMAHLFIWKTDTAQNVLPLFGLVAVAHLVARQQGIPISLIYERAARRHLLAPAKTPKKSAAIKAAVFAACRARGWRVCDHNASDALCVGIYEREVGA